MVNIDQLVRPNIRQLKPYSSARDEFKGHASVWLDANENPFNSGLNRYPDPRQQKLKTILAEQKGISPDQIFLGNGSDEPIDLLFRAFCEPNQDQVLIFPPTYGMYEVSANINAIDIQEQPLTSNFQIDLEAVLPRLNNPLIKMIFICTPNNPTGNSIDASAIEAIASVFNGIIVIDEAYADFSEAPSWINSIQQHPNIVVLQTFSKARGLAGIRLGMAYSSPEVIAVLNKIKPPYNISTLTQTEALSQLEEPEALEPIIDEIVREREWLAEQLSTLKMVKEVYPSDANFLLVAFENPKQLFATLVENGIILRDRTSAVPNTLRITVGTAEENHKLINLLKEMEA